MSFRRIFGHDEDHRGPSGDLNAHLRDSQWYVFGLGNIGSKYSRTRHNAGFEVIDIILGKKMPSLLKYEGEIFAYDAKDGGKVSLIKPQTYMNLSGRCVAAVTEKFRTKNIIIVSDDIDLPLGKIRIRKTGSAGTHNGLKSIINELDTEDFIRVRVGVGKPEGDLIEHVLSGYNEGDRKLALLGYEKAAKAVIKIIDCGIDAAQAEFN